MDIKYLLKFGQRTHLGDFVDGFLYCSNAEQLWKIEDEQKIKGQGDVLEASTIMHAQNITLLQPKTTNIIAQFGQSKGKVRFEPAKKSLFFVFLLYMKRIAFIRIMANLRLIFQKRKKLKYVSIFLKLML